VAKRRRLRQELIGDAADAATNEIDHYLSLRVPAELEDDPLRFWEKHQSSFPILSVVARVYLRMSATSVPVECMFSTTEIISNGKRSSIGPAKLNRILFIDDNFAFVGLPLTTDKSDGIDCVSVCFLCLSETLVGSTDGFFARKPALKRLASAVGLRRERPTGRSSYSRRESFEQRLSCEPDPTSEYVCFFARKSSL